MPILQWAATNFAFLTPTLRSYDANDVYLTVLPSNPTPQGTADYRTAAITRNQLAVAAGLTSAARPRDNGGRVVSALDQLTAQKARAAFDTLPGEASRQRRTSPIARQSFSPRRSSTRRLSTALAMRPIRSR